MIANVPTAKFALPMNCLLSNLIDFADNSIKEALFHEFKKVGEILNIKIVGTEKERHALVKFRRLVSCFTFRFPTHIF